MEPEEFDLVVVGSGPAGETGATQAASAGKRVAVVERAHAVGGAGVNTGTLPSKTLRETALYLSGARTRGLYGVEHALANELRLDHLLFRLHHVIATERALVSENLEHHNVALIHGEARFLDARTVEVLQPHGATRLLTAETFLVAAGSRPFRPPGVPFDGERVHDSDTILSLPFVPKSLAVVGAGVIGCEYASIFATLGIPTVLVDARAELLPQLDEEITERLRQAFTSRLQIDMRFGHEVEAIERRPSSVFVPLKDADDVETDVLLFAGGRQGNTAGLGLEAIGVSVSPRGQIGVDANFQTAVPHVYAAGDVVGFPALAATSMEQARAAMCHAFGMDDPTKGFSAVLPYGIYTVPEIGVVGETEQSLRKQGIDYEVGHGPYTGTARGQIIGDLEGLAKILFDPISKRLLGAHLIGENATDLVHLAAACMAFGGTIDYFTRAVFNYPTLSEAYKDAAYDGLSRLSQREFWQSTVVRS